MRAGAPSAREPVRSRAVGAHPRRAAAKRSQRFLSDDALRWGRPMTRAFFARVGADAGSEDARSSKRPLARTTPPERMREASLGPRFDTGWTMPLHLHGRNSYRGARRVGGRRAPAAARAAAAIAWAAMLAAGRIARAATARVGTASRASRPSWPREPCRGHRARSSRRGRRRALRSGPRPTLAGAPAACGRRTAAASAGDPGASPEPGPGARRSKIRPSPGLSRRLEVEPRGRAPPERASRTNDRPHIDRGHPRG